jgi:XTP/dITP diphosphohydrolase
MVKIVVATSNSHKLHEFNAINDYPDIVFDVVQGDFDPVEDGETFLENAIIKAKEAAKITKTYCLADDSGLCVDYLDGRPNIYSARYAPTAEERISKMLGELDGVPFEKRGAHFNCTMALVDKDGNVIHTEVGRVFGYIDTEPKGENGFGYDPIFFVPEKGRYMTELSAEEKNAISHRGKALGKMKELLKKEL